MTSNIGTSDTGIGNSSGPAPISALPRLMEAMRGKLGKHLRSCELGFQHVIVEISRAEMLTFFNILKLDRELDFSMMVDITVIDWLDQREDRFEVVYHLLSITHLHRLRVKISRPEESAEVDSLCSFWSAANFLEREAWDMYGINFKAHPNQERILMYPEFEGHPLRKDYPVQGKQPRIPLRSPEVRNTAVDMKRPALISINRRPVVPSAGTAH